jgi:hypothetical protein
LPGRPPYLIGRPSATPIPSLVWIEAKFCQGIFSLGNSHRAIPVQCRQLQENRGDHGARRLAIVERPGDNAKTAHDVSRIDLASVSLADQQANFVGRPRRETMLRARQQRHARKVQAFLGTTQAQAARFVREFENLGRQLHRENNLERLFSLCS